MATLARTFSSQGKLQLFLWLAGVASLATLLGLLSVAIKGDPVPSVDRTIMATVSGWDLPGLTGFANSISALTSNYPIAAIAFTGIVFLWLLGMTRAGLAYAVVGWVAAMLFLVGEHFLGDYVGR